MGTYLWPNSWFYASAGNHDEIMGYMKDWIEERSLWLDGNIPGFAVDCEKYVPPYPGLFTVTGLQENDQENNIRIYPNPVIDYLSIESEKFIREIVITNMTGQRVYVRTMHSKSARISINDLNQRGIFVINIMTDQRLHTKVIRLE